MAENRKAKRPSIYLSPPLQHVAGNLRDGQSLSQRLATVAERYQLICKQTPELTDRELEILGSALSGSHVEPLLIKHLDDEIEDSDAGEPAQRRELAERLRGMSIAERIALIESLGY
ncbi:hypothetical protein CZ787_17155 [Halomonas citrativorans]|uniref:Uncharacterized protein n=1 Tax=Halomonas citrativorans TaxID=2742612 RepID=A0A1R4I521_9GAMM|nr:hypothetical protein [Halomonas citrativorans]SJN14839.1 hypothetical protein CZ787_17155 [Halomonas citrativorans]